MINPYYFIEKNLKIGFKNNLGSRKNIHAKSTLSVTPIYSDFGIETRYYNKILKEMAPIYARLKNQFKFKYHILVSASFYKINEENQRSDETEIITNLINDHKLTQPDINNIEVKSLLEHLIQSHEMKERGWIFDKTISMKIRF